MLRILAVTFFTAAAASAAEAPPISEARCLELGGYARESNLCPSQKMCLIRRAGKVTRACIAD